MGENPYRKDRGDIGTDQHKTGVTKGKFTHIAVDQVEAHGHDDVDPYVDEDELDIVVEQAVVRDQKSQSEEDKKDGEQQPLPIPHLRVRSWYLIYAFGSHFLTPS